MATSFLLLLVLTLATSNALSTTIPKPKRLLAKLIHRDSIHSPYYNPSDTLLDRISRIEKSSKTRFTYLHSKIASELDIDDFRLNLFLNHYEPIFFVNFSIGQPPVPQFTIMDTGSTLLWVQCAPCTSCSKQIGPMLNPSKSSTYTNLTCQDFNCQYAPRGYCNPLSNQCFYVQTYIKGASSVGRLAAEQLTFKTSDEGTIVVSKVVFGCGHKNGNYSDERFTGILGLGCDAISLVSQLGSKFSYCLGNIIDSDYSYNQLILGDGANIEGYSTPLEVFQGRYYVNLEWISVGDKKLDIDLNIFQRKGSKKGVVIDTGTALTWLAQDAYIKLRREIENLVGGTLKRFFNNRFLCYYGEVDLDLIGFPVVTLHFEGGAELVLDAQSMFYQATSSMFCMAVKPSSDHGIVLKDFSVIGLMAQQNYNVGYDLVKYKLCLQRIDCSLLEE